MAGSFSNTPFREWVSMLTQWCFIKILTEAQKEIFEKFKANQAELNGIDEVTSFAIGFKLGLRLAAEAFVAARPEQEPVNN